MLRYPIVVALTAAALVASGCFVPRQVEYYDADCNIVSRKMVLDNVQTVGVVNCSHRECLAVILGVAVASMIVSGSIVVVGNTVYWLEKQGRCVEAKLR